MILRRIIAPLIISFLIFFYHTNRTSSAKPSMRPRWLNFIPSWCLMHKLTSISILSCLSLVNARTAFPALHFLLPTIETDHYSSVIVRIFLFLHRPWAVSFAKKNNNNLIPFACVAARHSCGHLCERHDFTSATSHLPVPSRIYNYLADYYSLSNK